jgi:DUF2075 family protein
MQLYAGSSSQFIQDTIQNQIAGKLEDSFFRHFRFRPSPGEVTSWQNSLRAVCQVFEGARLDDHGVLLEYQLPMSSKRLDCMVCGTDSSKSPRAVIIELKQWGQCSESGGEDLVTTWVGGRQRDVLHPSAQVRQYRLYLEDAHTAFYEPPDPIGLDSCAYLHNYHAEVGDHLLSEKFSNLIEGSPAFTADDVDPLMAYLTSRLDKGGGLPVLQRIQESKYRPSKKLMEHVGNLIKGDPSYVLLDEQLVVYQKVLETSEGGFHDRKKSVILVRGGPGTGKSVIALNLMGDLLLSEYNTHYATGSRAFTQTLRKIIGTRGGVQFKYFNSYMEAAPNEIDVLVCDEAHRIRKVSHDRWTPKAKRTDRPQIEELIDVSKVAVFFIDDKQIVRPNEIGSSELIREAAQEMGCRLTEYELEAQFRCAGSDGFVNWINNTLGIERTANVLWDDSEGFDFKVFDSPGSLEAAIFDKVDEGFSARLTAGFCWEWSDPNPDGTLVDDVQIGDYHRPWNAKSGAGRLAKGIPKESLWAHDPNGINQVGCVYTAQGFEFDYIGVIFGTDLTYNLDSQEWVGHKENSRDSVVARSGDQFIDLVKNTYRVLLSRGLKGCYLHFIDKDTERFIKSRVESFGPAAGDVAYMAPETDGRRDLPFRVLDLDEARPFKNCVPLYDLEAAAGMFSDEQVFDEISNHQSPDVEDTTWVELPDVFKPQKGLFVSRVIGESMNRRIPNGSWCVLRFDPQGSREGRIVLAQHRDISDADTGGHFTIKVYSSEKEETEDGGWRHTRITLNPDSTDESFEPIEFRANDAQSLKIIAELVAVLE